MSRGDIWNKTKEDFVGPIRASISPSRSDMTQKKFDPLHSSQSLLTRLASFLPPGLRALVQGSQRTRPQANENEYNRRVQEESRRFAGEANVNDLPPIFHYWSNKHLRPIFQSFGFSNPDEFFAQHIEKRSVGAGTIQVLSLGSGNCDTEVRVGQLLANQGISDWRITCLDLVPEMLKRGEVEARRAGLQDHFRFVIADFNQWDGDGARFDVVMANQCLHHVIELERLFDRIPLLLHQGGTFITSDMIGRNGHQRWPEAKIIVDHFWQELPPSYRYHRQLNRQEDVYLDWDCSVEGFEGIRSQDILPLLCERFGFELFLGFGNVIDPFVDRGFGWNFDAEGTWDRDFIDRVQAADQEALASRKITPTHMLAIMSMDRSTLPQLWRGRTPQQSIRIP